MEDGMTTFAKKHFMGGKGFVIGIRDEGVDVSGLRCEHFPRETKHFKKGD